jgi:type IV secretion system protein TrbG
MNYMNPLCAVTTALLLSASTFSINDTALAKPRTIDFETAMPATQIFDPPKPVEVVAIPGPFPLPGQLKRVRQARRALPQSDPKTRISAANAAARIQPVRDGFLNAIQQYPWGEGALYQVYTAPGQVTDIALQEGEQLVGPGPVAAGDTVRWIIGDTISGSGPSSRVHILVKPTRNDLATNLVINTDRRTYHLELHSSTGAYMASLSWTYPQDELIALRGCSTAAAQAMPVADGIDISALEFRYRLEGDSPSWKPLRVFDDGLQVFIEFPSTIAQDEMPPLFVVGSSGAGELVNYRVRGRYMIVDRLFSAAELRLGDKKSQKRVRIIREGMKSERSVRR